MENNFGVNLFSIKPGDKIIDSEGDTGLVEDINFKQARPILINYGGGNVAWFEGSLIKEVIKNA